MPKYHTGPGICHNGSDSISLFSLKAMNRAFGTGCFSLLEGTLFKTFYGVVKQLKARMAKRPLTPMMILTIHGDHCFNRPGFPDQPAMFILNETTFRY